jgi:hypothetical protein
VQQLHIQRLRLAFVLMALLSLLPYAPKAALATSHVSPCLPKKALGMKVPVLLVHGFIGSPAKTWTAAGVTNPIQDVLSKIPGIYANYPMTPSTTVRIMPMCSG